MAKCVFWFCWTPRLINTKVRSPCATGLVSLKMFSLLSRGLPQFLEETYSGPAAHRVLTLDNYYLDELKPTQTFKKVLITCNFLCPQWADWRRRCRLLCHICYSTRERSLLRRTWSITERCWDTMASRERSVSAADRFAFMWQCLPGCCRTSPTTLLSNSWVTEAGDAGCDLDSVPVAVYIGFLGKLICPGLDHRARPKPEPLPSNSISEEQQEVVSEVHGKR